VRGSCDGRNTGIFGQAMMAEPWEGMSKAAMAGTHKEQGGASGGVRCSH
jgi:hypothetical protein